VRTRGGLYTVASVVASVVTSDPPDDAAVASSQLA
jgi:hypothetical protein